MNQNYPELEDYHTSQPIYLYAEEQIGTDPNALQARHLDLQAYSATRANHHLGYPNGISVASTGSLTGFAAHDHGTTDFSLILTSLRLPDWTPASPFEIYTSHSTGNNSLSLTLQTSGVFRITIDNAGTPADYDLTPAKALTDNQFYQIIIALDRDGLATLYINGFLSASTSISASASVDIGSGNTNPYTLFNDADSTVTLLGYVAMTSDLLTSAEITTLWLNGLVDLSQDANLSWLLDLTTGNPLQGVDQSPPANFATYSATGVSPLLPGSGYRVEHRTITTAGALSFVLPARSLIQHILVENTTANPITGFHIGTSASANDVVVETDIPATTIIDLQGSDTIPGGASTLQLYTDATTWNSASLNLTLIFRTY